VHKQQAVSGRPTLTPSSAASRPAAPFFGKCCFPGIYFISNISFVSPVPGSRAGGADTPGLTHAVNNAWANGGKAGPFAGFSSDFTPQKG
jgi:hypothetical protein